MIHKRRLLQRHRKDHQSPRCGISPSIRTATSPQSPLYFARCREIFGGNESALRLRQYKTHLVVLQAGRCASASGMPVPSRASYQQSEAVEPNAGNRLTELSGDICRWSPSRVHLCGPPDAARPGLSGTSGVNAFGAAALPPALERENQRVTRRSNFSSYPGWIRVVRALRPWFSQCSTGVSLLLSQRDTWGQILLKMPVSRRWWPVMQNCELEAERIWRRAKLSLWDDTEYYSRMIHL